MSTSGLHIQVGTQECKPAHTCMHTHEHISIQKFKLLYGPATPVLGTCEKEINLYIKKTFAFTYL